MVDILEKWKTEWCGCCGGCLSLEELTESCRRRIPTSSWFSFYGLLSSTRKNVAEDTVKDSWRKEMDPLSTIYIVAQKERELGRLYCQDINMCSTLDTGLWHEKFLLAFLRPFFRVRGPRTRSMVKTCTFAPWNPIARAVSYHWNAYFSRRKMWAYARGPWTKSGEQNKNNWNLF